MPCRFVLSLLLLPSFLLGAEQELPLSKVRATPAASVSTPDKGPVSVRIAGGSKGYPGAMVQPPGGGFFNLSAYSRVEAVLRNTGTVELPVTMRVDNPGHWKKQPFSAESIRLGPGDTKSIVVFFGHKFGFQKGYPLDPSQIRQILFFTKGSEKERSFSIESVVAAGAPGETPEAWQNSMVGIPENGVLLGAGHPLESANLILAGATGV